MDSEDLRLELRGAALLLSAALIYSASIVRGIAFTTDAFKQCVEDAKRLRRITEGIDLE